MSATDLTITFSPNTIPLSDALILKQGKVGGGIVSKLDLVNTLASRLYGGASANIDCGIVNGKFGVEIFVYPYDRNLIYNIGLSHGELSNRTIRVVQVTENLNFSLTDKAQTTYPVNELISAAVIAPCWDADGGSITTPELIFDGVNITLAKKIYGTVHIIYTTIRHFYRSYIPARLNAPENPYQSVCWTNWNGGVKFLDLVVPDSPITNNESCAYTLHDRWLINIPDEKISPPEADGVHKIINIDYCSQKIRNAE